MNFTQVSIENIQAARRVIAGVADNTPLVPSPFMSKQLGGEFLLKLENMQPIGAFKLRGAMNAIAALSDEVAGVTCCSTGNHGRGVAFAAAKRGIRAVVCMSKLVPDAKVQGIKDLCGEVRIFGTSQDDADAGCKELGAKEGLVDISPFDDPYVIAGQGTIALEMLDARPDMSTILVPLSGGGLAGGIALAAKAIKPDIKVIGISMDRGAAMHLSIKAGHLVDVDELPSLADSLGGGLGAENKWSFGLCRDHLDDTLLVTEEEIRDAMQTLFFEDRIVAEGGSVVGLAAVQSGKVVPKGPVGCVITGRNLDMSRFNRIMSGQDITLGDKIVKGRIYGA